jgi:transposase
MMYPSDLTDTEWNRLQPLLPSPSPRGRPRLWALRHITNGIFHIPPDLVVKFQPIDIVDITL